MDDVGERLLQSGFDPHEYLERTLHLPNYDSENARLTQSLNVVNSRLHDEVSLHYESMLSEVQSLASIGSVFQDIHSTALSLQSSVSRLRRSLHEPYDQVTASVQQLSNMYATIELLRALTRFASHHSKLREHEAILDASNQSKYNTADLPRAARILREIEIVMAECNLAGLDAVDKNMDFIGRVSTAVRSRTHELLNKALATSNHADLSVALQACYNLNTLPKAVASIVADRKKEIHKVVSRELDPQSIQKAITSSEGVPGESEGARTRSILLGKLEATLRHTGDQLMQVASLYSVLQKKRDPNTQQAFWNVLLVGGDGSVDITASIREELWEKTALALKEKIQRLCKRPNFMLLFVSEYARVSHMLHRFVASLNDFFALVMTAPTTESTPASQDHGSLWIRDVLGECEHRFTTECAERLQERAAAFTARLSQALPRDPDQTAETLIRLDLKALGKDVLQEVTVLRGDALLLPLVLRNVHSIVSGIHTKCREAVAMVKSPSLTQLTSAASGAQAFHAAVHNALSTLHYDLTTLVSSIPSELLSDVKAPVAVEVGHLHRDLHEIEQTCVGILSPLCSVFTSNVHKLLMQVHGEDYGKGSGSSGAADPQSSKFVASVEARVGHVMKRILSLYERDAWTTALLSTATAALLKSACRLCAMVRPLSATGRKRLASDLKKIGVALGAVHTVETLRAPFQEWKGVRRALLLNSAGELRRCAEVTNLVISPVTSIHLCFQFVSEPSQLPSIHTKARQGMMDEFLVWVDKMEKEGDLSMLCEVAHKCLIEYQTNYPSAPGEEVVDAGMEILKLMK